MTAGHRRIAVAYLTAQGVLCAAWWLVLWWVPDARAAFAPASWPESSLWSFCLPDLASWVAGSWWAATALHRGWRSAAAWVGLVTGAVLYSTLYCVAVTWSTGEAWLAVALMGPAAACTVAVALGLHAGAERHR